MSKRLGKQEWINAGLKAMATEGVDAVRVERIAKALRVTKGSFYWHFKTRDELLEALLDEWKARATTAIIEEVEEQNKAASVRLRSLFTIVFASHGRLDREIRAWAAKDSSALAAVEQIDKRRLAYVELLFTEMGFKPFEAKARARFSYQALIGQFAMGMTSKPQGKAKKQFDAIFEMLVRID